MNSIRVQMLKQVPEAKETFGFITKEHRQRFTEDKAHSTDAVFIATQCLAPIYRTAEVFLKKCVSGGDYKQTRGAHSEQTIPTGKICGFRKFDKILYRGKHYFVKGKYSTGYATLMNCTGQAIKLKPIPKFDRMRRVAARKSWITDRRTMANTCL
jgi:hypothetical protein